MTRARTRSGSSIVTAETAALLNVFRTPSTIVDAVIAYGAVTGADPRATLEQAFPVLRRLVTDGVLVPASSPLAQPIAGTLVPGQQFGAFDVVSIVTLVVDTEVHFARGPHGEAIALKVARDGCEERVRGTFANEALILSELGGHGAPRLSAAGEVGGRPFVATSWCSGIDAHEAASELRALDSIDGRRTLLALVECAAGAYARLHGRGVLHADVHPRNVLVDGDDNVTIIDFGLGRRLLGAPVTRPAVRGGVDLFLEPEVMRARLAGTPLPGASPAGEQYSVAALLYLMVTGGHTHPFSVEPTHTMRQIAERPPLRFERHGIDDLPGVEAVLGRALSKRADERYGSIGDFRRALRTAAAGDLRTQPASRPRRDPAFRPLLASVLGRLTAVDGEFSPGAFGCSVHSGAAGIAYALLRISSLRDDAELLAHADLWSVRALTAAAPSGEAPSSSLYHGRIGAHVVAALIARSRGDDVSQAGATDAFVAAASQAHELPDVSVGAAGVLLGLASLLEALPATIGKDRLERVGASVALSLSSLASRPLARIASASLGAAHGWAGILFALARWSDVTGVEIDTSTHDRLAQLACLSRPAGRGAVWAHNARADPHANPMAAAWCNGAAGYVPLWTLAYRLTGDHSFSRAAGDAAWTAYEHPVGSPDMCCGLAGRAYALLDYHRHAKEEIWLKRAGKLAARAARMVKDGSAAPHSLYAGALGVALVGLDIAEPSTARMPLFDGSMWSPARLGDRHDLPMHGARASVDGAPTDAADPGLQRGPGRA